MTPGKEGVGGSSPSEGFRIAPTNAGIFAADEDAIDVADRVARARVAVADCAAEVTSTHA
jgi:hypothetical protein